MGESLFLLIHKSVAASFCFNGLSKQKTSPWLSSPDFLHALFLYVPRPTHYVPDRILPSTQIQKQTGPNLCPPQAYDPEGPPDKPQTLMHDKAQYEGRRMSLWGRVITQ